MLSRFAIEETVWEVLLRGVLQLDTVLCTIILHGIIVENYERKY